MKNKGFTLIEMIAVVIILGLIILIAVPFFTGSLNVFRDDYYANLSNNIKNAGNDFFSDNKLYLPHNLLDASSIKVSDLVNNKYLNEVKDYTGKSCDLSDSYVVVIRRGKDKYDYNTCLKCSEDDYDNTTNNSDCSSAWIDGFKMTGLRKADTVYVNVGASKQTLREKVVAYPSVMRCLKNDVACANPVESIKDDQEVEPIYPLSIDVVDTHKVGRYEVKYRYQNGPLVPGTVVVFANEAPNVSFLQTDIYHKEKISEGVATDDRVAYDPTATDDWAQRLFVIFSHTFTEGTVDPDTAVSRYQIYINGRWEDYCDNISGTNNSCEHEELREMNENVRFRFVDTYGNVSGATGVYNMRVDKTKPTCSLSLSGTQRDDEWFITKATVLFASKGDTPKNGPFEHSPSAASGIKRYVITTDELDNDHPIQDDDTPNVKWYGFVEDKARNWITCEIEFKQDVSSHTCSITGHATLTGTDSISKIKKADFRKDASNILVENIDVNYLSTWTDTKTVSVNGDWTLTTTNGAGVTCTTTSKYCKIIYDGNTGGTPTKLSEIRRETEGVDLTPTARKPAYKMIGWNTESTATKAMDSYEAPSLDEKTIYAIYTKCEKGQYTDTIGTSCIWCPVGYRDGEPKGSQAECEKHVGGGKYVKNNNDPGTNDCANGYYRPAHVVTYGTHSSCYKCTDLAAGYNKSDGTRAASTNCYMTVSAGKHKSSANGDGTSNCGNGTYAGEHKSYYGSNDSCSACTGLGSNYKKSDGNRTVNTNCYMDVPGGKRKKSKNSNDTQNCGANTWVGAHTSHYGSNDSCNDCPSGQESPAGSDSASDCYVPEPPCVKGSGGSRCGSGWGGHNCGTNASWVLTSSGYQSYPSCCEPEKSDCSHKLVYNYSCECD